MNTATQAERNALTLPERAAVALGASKTEAQLQELVKKSADIVEVSNMAGRDQAHRIGMDLKTARVLIEKTGKAAREDATAFSKAVIAEEKRLVEIITPEEDRVFALRDGWDTKVATERQAAIDAEVARVAKIASCIEAIREDETDAIRIDKTAEQTRATLEYSERRPITVEIFQERLLEAQQIHTVVLTSIRTVLAGRVAAEAAEAQRQVEAAAEAARIIAERAELEQLRAAAKVEAERVAAEQAAAAKRLAAIAAEDAARARAEQAERDRVSAQVKAQLEQQAAQLAADRKALEDERAADAKAKADAAAAVDAKARADALAAIEAVQAPVVVAAAPAAEQSIDAAAPAATWPFPSLRLGQINERIAPLSISVEGLRTLGFEPAAKDRAAQLYHEHDFPMICAALTRHISAVQAKQAA